MRGSVAADGSEAVLSLCVLDPGRGGGQAEVQAVIDTGFTGDRGEKASRFSGEDESPLGRC